VFVGRHTCIFRRGCEAEPGNAQRRKRIHYVKLMDELLHKSKNILVWGCGGGNLATRLSRLGKRLTIVDINPISFVLAHRYFDLPDEFAVHRFRLSKIRVR